MNYQVHTSMFNHWKCIFCYTATKLAQAQKFNDPKDPCKVLVATDAIGMGINL